MLDVLFDEVRIQRDRGGRAFAGGCDDLGARVVAFPAIHTPGTVVRPRGSKPRPRVHDGYEWLYVLSGRMRLVLGDRDLVLGVGEAAEFDTKLPHWFGSTGEGSAEILSLFGRPGERMHVCAKPSGR